MTCTRRKAPTGTIWVLPLTPTLLWLTAFLNGHMSPLFQAYVHPASRTTFVIDASPRCLGVLIEDGVATSYISEPASKDDIDVLGVDIGSATCQQVVEALAMLVSLCTWANKWQPWRSTVAVRGDDNVTVLTMVQTSKGFFRTPRS